MKKVSKYILYTFQLLKRAFSDKMNLVFLVLFSIDKSESEIPSGPFSVLTTMTFSAVAEIYL